MRRVFFKYIILLILKFAIEIHYEIYGIIVKLFQNALEDCTIGDGIVPQRGRHMQENHLLIVYFEWELNILANDVWFWLAEAVKLEEVVGSIVVDFLELIGNDTTHVIK